MAKKSSETFKEYAQRWKELAAQVEPPLYEKEMITMFIETLQAPFYEHVLGSISSNFSDIVTIGERIEHGLKTGKIAQVSLATTGAKKYGFNPDKEKERERKEITDDDVTEFLKFIQQSEYKVVDQLNRMPARVSLLELLMHSNARWKLLMKILNGAHVEQDPA